ncbi:MAG: hypothetical protein MUE45_06775 [Methanoregulaceae archaeon]|jgi:hypothetical protein|nr:hypothetical protein [Methanoregulaceae archaeon]MCU0629171.1 hypothetical protein [Methanoregulaceae archaeon]
MDSRDIFIVAVLLSAGTLLRFILVMVGETVTPNILVAFYSIAIMLILPSFGEAMGIGFISGVISALISRSLINPAFLLSEPLGAAICLLVFISLRYHKRAAPYAAAFTATIASGAVFTALALSLAGVRVLEAFLHTGNFLATMVIVITATALVNAVIAGLFYPFLRNYQERYPR